MESRRFFFLALSLLLVSSAGAVPRSAIASAPIAQPSACGPHVASTELIEPPDVDVWELPIDANGERELILAVHKDGDRFCYRYTLDGVSQTVPPTIRVRRGEHFAVRIVNDISGASRGEHVASTAIPPCKPMAVSPPAPAHWVGYLNHTIDDRFMHMPPIDTNLHLHGFQGSPAQENIFLSSLSSPMQACEYRVTIPRTQPPGTYIYHPHAHGASDPQVAGGLNGAWIVEPDSPQLPRSDEHVIVLRYQHPLAFDNTFAPDEDPFGPAAMAREAALTQASPVPYDPFAPPPWPVTFPMRAGGVALDSSGCNGLGAEPTLAVNRSHAPATLTVAAGVPQLLRIVNGTSDSDELLRLRDGDGHTVPMQVVGLDGVPVSGDMEHPIAHYVAMRQVMITAMSRVDILVTASAGEALTLSRERYCDGAGGFFQMHHDLLRVAAAPGAAGSDRPPSILVASAVPAALDQTPAARLLAYARANPDLVRRRAITFTEYLFPKRGKTPPHYGFYVTDTTNPTFREHPFWPQYAPGADFPSNPDVVVKRGTVEEWYLINATMESHAFHIHQMAFVEETSFAGIPLTRDTVFVPVGKLLPNKAAPNYPLAKPSVTKILLDFRHVPRGTFVFHCHMLFHEDRGMMAVIRVV